MNDPEEDEGNSSEPVIENVEIKKKNAFERVFGFTIEDITSWHGIVKLLHRPTDPSSLAVARILFGR